MIGCVAILMQIHCKQFVISLYLLLLVMHKLCCLSTIISVTIDVTSYCNLMQVFQFYSKVNLWKVDAISFFCKVNINCCISATRHNKTRLFSSCVSLGLSSRHIIFCGLLNLPLPVINNCVLSSDTELKIQC